MAVFCLTQPIADKFLAAIKDGTIDPSKMSTMSSKDRHKFLEGIVGKDNALDVNALFESKLLLKNQQAGMVAWAKKLSGMTKVRRQDLIAKIERLDRVLGESEQKAFLSDLAESRLGVGVTQEEANKIADMTREMTRLEEQMKQSRRGHGEKATDAEMAYGRARVDLTDYVSDLKNNAKKVTLQTFKERPGNALVQTVSGAGGFSKSLKASLDDSALLRQGWKTMMTNPGIWAKNAAKSFKDAVQAFGGKNVMREVHADIVSRPTYQQMLDAKLAVSVREEAFPTSLPERIPLFGRFFKGSETAYTAFLDRTRADVFDKYIQIAERTGVNVKDPEQLRAIGRLVNSLTGRGHMGGLEQIAPTVNNVFFSARNVKSHIDVLTAHTFDKSMTPFARKMAAKNLVKIVAGTAGVLGVAAAVNPDSVEFDPRSADFGKIKVGNTRFDVTGGMGSIVTLAARLITGQSKSTKSGEIYDKKRSTVLFGDEKSRGFFENKLSPIASVVDDLLRGETYDKEKPTLKGEVQNLLVPLPISNAQKMMEDPNAAPVLLGIIADALGISAQNYSPIPEMKRAFIEKPSQKVIDEYARLDKTGNGASLGTLDASERAKKLKEKVGEQTYNDFVNYYGEQFRQEVEKTIGSGQYRSKNDEEKAKMLNSIKSDALDESLEKFGYEPETKKKTTKKGSIRRF